MNPLIRVVYEGLDADRHEIDMKYFGQSLQGTDRIISDGILLLTNSRLPKKGERALLLAKVQEPKAGSYDTLSTLTENAGVLGLGVQVVADIGADYLYNFMKAVMAHFGGKTDIAEIAMNKMVEINRDHLMARDRSENRFLELVERKDERTQEISRDHLELIKSLVATLGPAAEQHVAPHGRSVDSSTFSTGTAERLITDAEDAAAIRANNKIEWDKIAPLSLETDGFKFHTSGLSVKHPDHAGYIMAKVSDPIFAEEENSYTEAAQRKAVIMVMARKGYRNGALAKIDIVEFTTELP